MADKKNFLPKTIYQVYSPTDLSKKWFVYWYENGKRIRKYGNINKYHTEEERQLAAKKIITQLRIERLPKHTPVKTQIEEWLYEKQFWRNKSVGTYQSVVNTFFDWLGKKDLNNDSVKVFFLWLGKERSGSTYNKYREKLGQMFRAVGYDHLMKDIESAKEERIPAKFFQPYQIKRLKAFISGHDPTLWLFVQFIYYCFIRPGELRQLRVGDVLLEERKIMVSASISKNRKTQYVAIPEAFLPSLMYLEEERPGDYIFRSNRGEGNPIGMNTMAVKHQKILKKMGFSSEYKLYSWKHTGAVMAVKSGVGLKELQMQLRHHSLDQVNEYLRQMGVMDMKNLQQRFPAL